MLTGKVKLFSTIKLDVHDNNAAHKQLQFGGEVMWESGAEVRIVSNPTGKKKEEEEKSQ